MKIRYDPSVDAQYIHLRDRRIEESDEIAPQVIVGYGADGKSMGIEILDASEVLGGKEMRVELAVADGKG